MTALPDHDPSPSEGPLRRWVLPGLVAALVLSVLDGVWITLVARGLYESELGERLADPVVGWASAVFYVIYLVGLMVLVIRPALDAGSTRTALGRGAALGLSAYATFGFTNLAVIEDWPVAISVADTLWGGALTATTAVITLLVCSRLRRAERGPDRASPR
ncbi:DUF2177 family protein [Janibacter sp. GS2]|uniref:DUF2177 family protein n=1 Tax=Janibacter sp. GS2 TaxID=3442646 RepID=UPI003EBB8E9E